MIDATTEGEREFRPRAPGPLWIWVKRASFVELAIFMGLLVVWVAILRREAPFWLFAATLTPVGPVGSVLGIEWIERRGAGPPEVARSRN